MENRGRGSGRGRGAGSMRIGEVIEVQGAMKNSGEELLLGGTKDFPLALSCRRLNCSLLRMDSTLTLPHKDLDRVSSLSLVGNSIRIPTSTSKASDTCNIINRVRDRGLVPHQDRGRQ
jgi:hypothetical protein